MCGIAESLMVTQYVRYNRQFNGDTICGIQKTVQWGHIMCRTADSLVVTQYVLYSREFNGDTICAVQQTV